VRKRFFLAAAMLIFGIAGQGFSYPGSEGLKAGKAVLPRPGPSRERQAAQNHSVGMEKAGTGTGVQGLSADVTSILNELGANQVGERIQVSLSGDVLFDYGRWDIKKGAEKTLVKLAEVIRKLKIKKLLIEGYTDSKGTKHYNRILSLRRADAVKTWLVEKGGVTGVKIVTKGCGASKPVAPNTHPDGTDNPEGRARNRRVEIYVTLQGS